MAKIKILFSYLSLSQSLHFNIMTFSKMALVFLLKFFTRLKLYDVRLMRTGLEFRKYTRVMKIYSIAKESSVIKQ